MSYESAASALEASEEGCRRMHEQKGGEWQYNPRTGQYLRIPEQKCGGTVQGYKPQTYKNLASGQVVSDDQFTPESLAIIKRQREVLEQETLLRAAGD